MRCDFSLAAVERNRNSLRAKPFDKTAYLIGIFDGHRAEHYSLRAHVEGTLYIFLRAQPAAHLKPDSYRGDFRDETVCFSSKTVRRGEPPALALCV